MVMRLARGIVVLTLLAFASPAWGLELDDRTESLGFEGLFKTGVTPVWIDMDGDGSPDPLWLSHNGWFSLERGPDGASTLKELAKPTGYIQTDEGDIVSVVLDVDGDATPELIVINERIELYRLEALAVCPGEEARDLRPPASVADTAVGDLNGDGFPDIVAGTALYRGEMFPAPVTWTWP